MRHHGGSVVAIASSGAALVLLPLAGLSSAAPVPSSLATADRAGAPVVRTSLACTGGGPSDFNGDGLTDIAIADPDATVGGVPRAGRVHVVYGGGKGSQTVSQADEFVDGVPEPSDRFGFALGSVDYNSDGCDDLAVSAPYESLGTHAAAGNAQVLLGSPSGFGPNGIVYFSQNATGMPGGGEAGDRFGYSLAVGKTTGGESFFVFGVPGEDLNSAEGISQSDAGAFNYVRGSTKLMIHQDSPGVPGVIEHDDQYGLAVAATTRHLAVSSPGETVGEAEFAGGVAVFTHNVSAGAIADINQEFPGQTGAAEPSDWVGRSMSMVDYIPAGGTAADARSLLAIGIPGEALGPTGDSGRAMVFEVSAEATERPEIHHAVVEVDGGADAADYLGWTGHLVNRSPGQPVTWQNLLLAVGIPGEEGAGRLNEGAVQVFSMVGAPGDHDTWAQPALAGAGYASTEDGALGRHLGGSATHLYVADPFGASPAVYAVPWANLTDGAAEPVVVYAPGSHGLPATGTGSFGTAIV